MTSLLATISAASAKPWLAVLMLGAIAAGCGGGGGGRDPILGTGNASLVPVVLVAPPGSLPPSAGTGTGTGTVSACPTALPGSPSVIATNPTDGNQAATTSTAGALNGGKQVQATFSTDMNPASINNLTFSLAPTGSPALTPTVVTYDIPSRVATLATASALLAGTNYIAVIQGTVASAAGVPAQCSYSWSFKTATTTMASISPVPLSAAASFGGFGGNATLTNDGTPAVPIQVQLINGGQSKNVFWYTPAGATIGTASTMTGTILADASITISTTGGSPPTAVLTTLNGRAIALTAGVTMTNTVVDVPAP